MAKIKKIWARQILDSRGIPTIEAACQLDSGHISVSSVPSGASRGTHEAIELRDNDQTKYLGKGVQKSVASINQILGPKFAGTDPLLQVEIDEMMIKMDGTKNKSKYGANATLAVSEVVAKAAALAQGQSLYHRIEALAKLIDLKTSLAIPTPLFNMINGGLHGAGNLDFQEFFVLPVSTQTYSQGLQACVEVYMAIGLNLERRGAIHSVGDEGGYAPNLFTNADALGVLVESINEAGYSIGRDLLLGLDVAASFFYKNGSYAIKDKTMPLDTNAILQYYKSLNERYRLVILEDPLFEDDWEGWKKLTAMLSDQMVIVGDDLLVTSRKRVQKAIKEKACNGVLIKPNQIGTVTETLRVIKLARDAGWKIVVSHRSGETNDWFIADFAVGVGADYVKFGAPARGERVAKYNRLLSIESEIKYSRGQ